MNGLIKTLIKPDWDDSPKRSEILHAANLLQIGEFQLIQLAYKVWYNEDLPEEKINKIFFTAVLVLYLFICLAHKSVSVYMYPAQHRIPRGSEFS